MAKRIVLNVENAPSVDIDRVVSETPNPRRAFP
ncbi:hypothetical protein BN961_00354 [Afipia felis]|uniref:Uncharacterized protein n=1 Tax=Afipia felis TaxID=1035 RepID=A0A090N6J7_AFIFE|nr:hypothetical protein BN961_00354 [Afipia felis]